MRTKLIISALSFLSGCFIAAPGAFAQGKKSNVVYFLVDNLGMGELSSYTDPALPLPNPHLVNLDTDPKEREPVDYPYLDTWVSAHVAKILSDYEASVKREPLIFLGAPLDFIPKRKQPGKSHRQGDCYATSDAM